MAGTLPASRLAWAGLLAPGGALPSALARSSRALASGPASGPLGGDGDPPAAAAAAKGALMWRARSTAASSSGQTPPQDRSEAAEALAYRLQRAATSAVEEVVPWFTTSMPERYWWRMPASCRDRHVQAIAALRTATGAAPELVLQSADIEELVYVRPGDVPGMLHSIVADLPVDKEIARLWSFTSLDRTLALNVLQSADRPVGPEALAAAEERLRGHAAEAGFPAADLEAFLARCRPMDVLALSLSPARFLQDAALYRRVSGTETVDIHHEHGAKENEHVISVAVPNATPKFLLERLTAYLASLDMNIDTLDLFKVDDPGHGEVAFFNVRCTEITDDGTSVSVETELGLQTMLSEIKRLSKWVDDRVLDLILRMNAKDNQAALDNNRLAQAEVVIAFCNMLHGMLSPQNPYAFSRTRIFEVALSEANLPVTLRIARLFLDKFDPKKGGPAAKMPEADLLAERRAIEALIEKVDDDEVVGTNVGNVVLSTMLEGVTAALKTNVYLNDRYALSIRMDPQFLGHGHATVGDATPYGTFFVHGRRFNGFHVRFADIARGGLRVLTPPTAESHALASTTHYTECYSLAYAQQLKNKDIPEGGAKAVILVEPHNYSDAPADTSVFIRHKSVKAFADAILDLLSPEERCTNRMVDYFGEREILYFGPDEQITPQDITWIVDRAEQRSHPAPSSFMSSKPDAGINHKEYGVTSEGIAVFLDNALRAKGVDTDRPFTVSMTGGTDGDVAGNMLKILHRNYGDNVRVVGICDGTATLEAPKGLDMQELLRLVEEARPLCDFDDAGAGAGVRFARADTPEGVHARNTMHNRIRADAFLPCGGRPGTISEENWGSFVGEDGQPASGLIVEGANLFITPAARRKLLEEAGVVIVKDSSANKCGVICSSYEIIASMLLSKQEFLDHKAEIVRDVLVKLRELADQEAKLLFRQHLLRPDVSLPDLSVEISSQILRAHAAIMRTLESQPEDALRAMLLRQAKAHLPAKLLELGLDHLEERIPEAYLRNVIGKSLASHIVYKEGLEFISYVSDDTLGDVTLRYLAEEDSIEALVREVEASGMEHAAKIKALLLKGGVRAAVTGGAE